MKEKQIEEMAKIIGDNTEQDTMWSEIYDCANALYNVGYRKVPEGAMILTRAELDFLNKYQERFKGQDAEAVIATEVAKEIFAEIEAIPMENMPYAVCLNIQNKIAELKKKYTEEGK